MGKLTIALIDMDESYIMPLEIKFLQGLGDNLDLIEITNVEFLETFLNMPQNIDILIIDEKIYSNSFERLNIGKVFFLTEERNNISNNLSKNKIFKYTSVTEIYNQVIDNELEDNWSWIKERRDTKVVMVYSPIGGCGKTVLSLGLCSSLAKMNKRVLYIDTGTVQSFFGFFKEYQFLSSNIVKHIFAKNEDIQQNWNNAIGTEEFDYLLPIKQSIATYNIKMEQYKNMIEKLKEESLYDYIILDTSTEFTTEKTGLMGYCDKIILITGQDSISQNKMNSFLENIDYTDNERFIFVSNIVYSMFKNIETQVDLDKKFIISEYIQEWDDTHTMTINSLGDNVSYNNIAKLL
ncbi:AAA family ATPase [Anaeromicropila herbilytica]|uniref:Chromosome partitioning protein ParA n=1 Tax=Anaeromicropila herbilytica TaxID=2785025 RepID=A0A7R7ENX5_9FIRM|nr:AAA family ATPase [Anaeromicropila herbilytica]BCN32355.1 chromosome partitioning protein ParA [Anaeromicropila herbilytica]